jgi:hypothetical protein
MILRAFGITILAIAFVALTVAVVSVSPWLLTALIPGAVLGAVRALHRLEPEPPAEEPEPGEWTPRPRKRDPGSPD